jgi:hypothetical protein
MHFIRGKNMVCLYPFFVFCVISTITFSVKRKPKVSKIGNSKYVQQSQSALVKLTYLQPWCKTAKLAISHIISQNSFILNTKICNTVAVTYEECLQLFSEVSLIFFVISPLDAHRCFWNRCSSVKNGAFLY